MQSIENDYCDQVLKPYRISTSVTQVRQELLKAYIKRSNICKLKMFMTYGSVSSHSGKEILHLFQIIPAVCCIKFK